MAAKAISVLRVKRKLNEEPVDGLLLALKKQKYDTSEDSQSIYFKFATTLQSQEEPLKDHLHSVLSKEKNSKYTKWRDPKRRNTIESLRVKLKSDHKAEGSKKRLDLVNNRRLVFTETLQVDADLKEEGESEESETLKLFQLYDVIEDAELMKTEELRDEKQESVSTITCNGVPLVHEKKNSYVFDVYVTDSHIDDTFMEHTVSLKPIASTEEDLVYSDQSEDDVYEDEDDSNDENNWRNDYPDEDEDFTNDIDYRSDDRDERNRMLHDFESCELGDSEDEYEAYKARIIKELKEDYSSEEEVSD